MELMQLRCFMIVAKYENMTKAANELNVVQPAVSRSIGRLESEIGVRLFDRQGKKLMLNEAGIIFRERVEKVLAMIDGLHEDLESISKGHPVIRFRIEAGSAILPEMLNSFGQIEPQLQIIIGQGAAEDRFDLKVTSSLIPPESEAEGILLLKEEIYLLLPKDVAEGTISIEKLMSLKDENFVGLKQGNAFRDMTDRFCEAMGFTPGYIFESDNPSIVRSMIAAGRGMAFFPELSWGDAAKFPSNACRIDGYPMFRYLVLLRNPEVGSNRVIIDKMHRYVVAWFEEFAGKK